MFSFPDIVGKGIFVGIDYGFYTAVHYPECLEGPEVASGEGEFLVFEEQSVAQTTVEHKVGLLLSVPWK